MQHHIYHHNDMDGHASGALVGIALERDGIDPANIHYYESSYGEPFCDENIDYDNDIIYIVDFSLQPLDLMRKLSSRAKHKVVWIDHHKTSFEWMIENQDCEFDGTVLNNTNGAACMMVWNTYYTGPAPEFIEILSDYDTWNKKSKYNWDSIILPIQSYMKQINTKPSENIDWWKDNFAPSKNRLRKWIEQGIVINNFEAVRLKKNILANGYECTINGYKAFVVNSSDGGSRQFEVSVGMELYDFVLVYLHTKGKFWTVSIYLNKDYIDCSAICKQFGSEGPFKSGGGHKGAAGFQTDTEHLMKIIGR
jgi:oligoribonuclease NrnB/cAMP/cGMP phosphodiesterase (DHH superfamily)